MAKLPIPVSALLLLSAACCVTVPARATSLFVTSGSSRVLQFDWPSGAYLGEFDFGVQATGVAFGPDGNLYIAVYWYGVPESAIYRFNGASLAPRDIFVPHISGSGVFEIAFGPDGNLYAADNVGDRVLRFAGTTGAPLGPFVTAGSGGLSRPIGLRFGPDGDLYVAGAGSGVVNRYDGTSGAYKGRVVDLGSAVGLAFTPNGELFVSSIAGNDIVWLSSGSHGVLGAFGTDVLYEPWGLALGPDGDLYVCDNDHSQIVRFSVPPGLCGQCDGHSIFVPFNSAGLAHPQALAFSPENPTPVRRSTWGRIKTLFR